VPVELGSVSVGPGGQEGALAVWKERAGRVHGVQILEAAFRERVAELRMCRTADPEWMPGAEHVVVEPGLGQLRRADRASELRLALEYDDSPTRAREERAAGKRIHSAADDDRVVLSHVRARETRRP
jgi:hypothetical protein